MKKKKSKKINPNLNKKNQELGQTKNSAKLENLVTWTMSLKNIAIIERIITPEEWPNPQDKPFFSANFGFVIDEGAIAIRWSAPLITWIIPAIRPVGIIYCINACVNNF